MRTDGRMAEQEQRPSPAYQVLKVLYAPQKAFKQILKEPKYAGPALVMILFIAANVGYGYAVLSKTYVEQTIPQAGQLNQWNDNATKWTSNVNKTENFNDYINGSYYGNNSIEFSAINSSRVFVELMNIGPVDCSEPNGYKNMSFRIKIVDPQISPANAAIYLFSQENSSATGNSSGYFYQNLTDTFLNISSTVWNNLTISIGPTGQWQTIDDANWTDITGLKLEFSWLGNSNVTLLVDGLFFRGIFESPLQTAGASYLIDYGIVGLLEFGVQWIFASGLILVIAKAFGAKITWKPILVAVGFAFIILLVQSIINAVAVSTLPNLYYTLEYIGGTQAEMNAGANKLYTETWLVSAIMGYVRLVVYIWIIALCASATRLLTSFSWVKSILVAAVAFIVTIVITLLLGV
jgi:hypothetical protein